MSAMSVFKPAFIEQRVALSPRELDEAAEDIDAYLVGKLRQSLEGRCCSHGFVKSNSVELVSRSLGQAENGRFTGAFMFTVKVKLMCFLPFTDQRIRAKVLHVNKMGAMVLLAENIEAIRINLPRELHLARTDFDGLQKGYTIQVRILKSRFQKDEPFINAVGLLEQILSDGADEAEDGAKEEDEADEAEDENEEADEEA